MVPIPPDSASINFDTLGMTLSLLDGESVTLALSYKRRFGDQLFGGITGALHLFTQAEVDQEIQEIDPPPRNGMPSHRAHYFKVGDLELAVGDAWFVRADYRDGLLHIQDGPIVMTLNFRDGNDHA